MHVLGTFLLAIIVNYYVCFSWLFLIQTDFFQIQSWIWQRYETHGNKSNKVKFIVIVLKLVIHSLFFFYYWDILEFTLFTKTMLVRQHVYLSKFCINKLFNLCLRYLLGRLWYPGVGGRKGVAPLCGLSEYVLSIRYGVRDLPRTKCEPWRYAVYMSQTCATDETILWLSAKSAKQRQNP